MKLLIRYLFLLLVVLAISACDKLARHADALKPTAELVKVKLADIDFRQADLLFDFAIDNKQPVPLRLSGLRYDFKIENRSLVSGVTAKSIDIEPNAVSNVQLPVSLKFADLKSLPAQLQGKDRMAYLLQTHFDINLPVIGKYSIPVSKQGELPVPRLPTVKLREVKVNKLSYTAAELVALVEINNPNAFNLVIRGLDYRLNMNRQSWGQGSISRAASIPQKGTGTVELPLRLNLLSMGSTVYQALVKKQPLEYQLTGGMAVDTGMKLLDTQNIPLNIKGVAALR